MLLTKFRSLLLVMALGLSATVHAGPILDQAYDERVRGFFINGGAADIHLAQTFTVGLSGVLKSVDVAVSRTDGFIGIASDLRLEILQTEGGFPKASGLLGSVVIPRLLVPSSGTDFLHILTPALPVLTGDVLSLVLRLDNSVADTQYEWWSSRGDGTYAAGMAFYRMFNMSAFSVEDRLGVDTDRSFRTYVEPAVVPEPSFLTMLGCGILGLAMRNSRRRLGRG